MTRIPSVKNSESDLKSDPEIGTQMFPSLPKRLTGDCSKGCHKYHITKPITNIKARTYLKILKEKELKQPKRDPNASGSIKEIRKRVSSLIKGKKPDFGRRMKSMVGTYANRNMIKESRKAHQMVLESIANSFGSK